MQRLQRPKPCLRIADIRPNRPAQRRIPGGQRKLYHAFGLPMDTFQQIQIPQNPVRFRMDHQPKPISVVFPFPYAAQFLKFGVCEYNPPA